MDAGGIKREVDFVQWSAWSREAGLRDILFQQTVRIEFDRVQGAETSQRRRDSRQAVGRETQNLQNRASRSTCYTGQDEFCRVVAQLTGRDFQTLQAGQRRSRKAQQIGQPSGPVQYQRGDSWKRRKRLDALHVPQVDEVYSVQPFKVGEELEIVLRGQVTVVKTEELRGVSGRSESIRRDLDFVVRKEASDDEEVAELFACQNVGRYLNGFSSYGGEGQRPVEFRVERLQQVSSIEHCTKTFG